MKVLALCGSLRAASHNRRLLELGARHLASHGVEVDLAPPSALDLPLFNQDLVDGASGGFPPAVEALRRRFDGLDGLVIASPEYNYTMGGVIKNALDWLSRYRPMPMAGLPGLVMATSTGVIGGIRGLWQLRIPLEGCGVLLHPDMFALPSSGKNIDENGNIADPALAERFEKSIGQWVTYARKLRA
jgi:chromate reductase